jgi:hypothetical protein
LLLALVIPLKSFAEDQTKLTPAQIVDGRSEAQVANTLIIIGRSAKDPDMLLVAAKLLSTVEAGSDPKATAAGGKPVFYDVDGLVAEAKSYSANRSAEQAPAVAELFRLLPLRISLR